MRSRRVYLSCTYMSEALDFEFGGRSVFGLRPEVTCVGTSADSGLHNFKVIPAKPIYSIFAHRRCTRCQLVPQE